ncbi:hypothetical protein Goklo_009088 [Gossypium klotzschianum]|uniref:Uncharacterized protein n=1 Tax=Gossypium klotzschianum TaxID=34286 RepID=A0A7J8V238_9ROSI|nr:hypothetical protein [Gossypium klotzschianum]
MQLLQILDFSRTSIKSLPKSLPKLVALKKLLLQGCDLSQLAELSIDLNPTDKM